MCIRDRKYGSNDLDFNVELTGGDPINNPGTWDRVAYNGALLDKYIQFDYVDATGKSCLTGNIRDLDKITALKVTFKAVSYTHLDVYKRQGVAPCISQGSYQS